AARAAPRCGRCPRAPGAPGPRWSKPPPLRASTCAACRPPTASAETTMTTARKPAARRWSPDLPVRHWARQYDRDTLLRDALAAAIVTLMLIPQSLAYAQLAGLPPEVGLYASVAPLVIYALLGTSRVLAVGPVAVVSLMTAAAVGEHAAAGTGHYIAVAITLAFLSGLIL